VLQSAFAAPFPEAREHYSRRHLLLHEQEQLAATLQQQLDASPLQQLAADEASEAAVVGLTFSYRLQQLVADLGAQGAALASDADEREAAIAATSAQIKTLAGQV
jgi:hypothetical protein